jgi:hypothetical protein
MNHVRHLDLTAMLASRRYVYCWGEREVPMCTTKVGYWGKADLIGQPLAVSHENPRKHPG